MLIEAVAEADVPYRDLMGLFDCLDAYLGTSAAAELGSAVGEAAAVGPEFAVAVVGSVSLSLRDIAAPILGYAPEGCLHLCPRKSKVPLEEELLLGVTPLAYPARCVADPDGDPPAGFSPPPASGDLPLLSRGANSAWIHPDQPTETEGRANVLMEQGL